MISNWPQFPNIHPKHTNGDGFDLDTLLNVSIGGIIGILTLQDLLVAQGVDECSSACWHLVVVLRVS